MARYIKYPKNMVSHTDFVGWDHLDDEACEATREEDLWTKMTAEDAAIFSELVPGQAVTEGAFNYARIEP